MEKQLGIQRTLAAVQDHRRQFQSFTFVYPVISRRSGGLSLGINLNPDKVCNFNCIYCEVNRRLPGRIAPVDVARLQEELTALIGLVRSGDFTRQSRFSGLDDLIQEIRDIAFSGDGEPTMATNFVQCMAAVAAVKRAEGLDQVKIVLITNGAGLDRADVRSGLEILDANQGEIWGKLDAGTEPYFRLVNRTSIRFERILLNLLETARARPIVIQSLFLKVHGEIIPAAELEEYCQRLNELVQAAGRIKEVHAYTVARPTPEPFAAKLSAAELETLAAIIRQRTRLVVKCFP